MNSPDYLHALKQAFLATGSAPAAPIRTPPLIALVLVALATATVVMGCFVSFRQACAARFPGDFSAWRRSAAPPSQGGAGVEADGASGW